MSDSNSVLPTGSTEMVPLSFRMWGLTVFRFVNTALLSGLSIALGVSGGPTHWIAVVGYLVVASGFTALLYTPYPRLRIGGFGFALILDGAFLQYQQARVGNEIAVDLSVAAFLVAVALLASFRTGLKLALWQSLLMLVMLRSQQSGLLPAPAAGIPSDRQALTDQVLLWVVVLTTAVAASINERELRRRRYDAEALQSFASILHQDSNPQQVANRSLRFVVDELLAKRALVVRQHATGLELIAGHGLEPGYEAWGPLPSPLLDLASKSREPSLVLRLDPLRDRWLDALTAGARRLIVVRLDAGVDQRTWMIVQHSSGRGIRVERRTVATVAQAAATTALALSRANLLEQARVASLVDALTGIPNRRRFDEMMLVLTNDYRRSGEGFAIAMVDVDKFKAINDSIGHQGGDEVLQAVARVLSQRAGSQHIVARYGGEEFAVVMPGLDAPAGAEVAESLRVALHSISDPVTVTASFGVAAVPGDAVDGPEVITIADAALYRAKSNGRNRVEVAFSVRRGGHARVVVDEPPRSLPAPRTSYSRQDVTSSRDSWGDGND